MPTLQRGNELEKEFNITRGESQKKNLEGKKQNMSTLEG
jgi:hypothetical protein